MIETIMFVLIGSVICFCILHTILWLFVRALQLLGIL